MSRIKKCLFPVAGYGTRFLPATKSMPKEMLPIVNKPLVQYGVEEAFQAGLTDIAFVTGRGKRSIEDHFDISYELEHQIQGTGKEVYLEEIRTIMERCNFTYTRQISMQGLGHAILTGEKIIGDQPFGVVLADDLCVETPLDGVMGQMVKLFNQFRCSIVAVEEVADEDIHKYGVIAGKPIKDGLFQVADMVEKPSKEEAPSNLAIIGRYILTPDIFQTIRATPAGRNGEIQITDALLKQAKQGCVLAYKFNGRRFDCGSVQGFVEATNFCYEHYYLRGQNAVPSIIDTAKAIEAVKAEAFGDAAKHSGPKSDVSKLKQTFSVSSATKANRSVKGAIHQSRQGDCEESAS